MKKATICLVLLCAFSFCLIQAAHASAEMDALLKLLIEKGIITEGEATSLKAEVAEEVAKEPEVPTEPKVVKSIKPVKKIELGGELELEFVKAGSDCKESDPHFQLDTFYLYPKAYLTEDIFVRAELAFKTTKAYVEEVYARFSNLPLRSWLEAGLNDKFIALIDRKTEAEILIETAFYRSDDIGITLGGEPLDWLYWRFAATNGLKLGTKQPSEENCFHLIYDARNTSEANHRPMYGVGVGLKHDFGTPGKIDVLPFYYNGLLFPEDVTLLQGVTGYGTSDDRDKLRYGFNLRYDIWKFTLIAQLLKARDGKLDRDGFFIQPSYKFTIPEWERFNAYELVYRYNKLDVDLPNIPEDSLTWDRVQHVIGVITDIVKNVKLKIEYYINEEDTGDGGVDNNEFLTQLEIKF